MITNADAARIPLPDKSVHCVVTSPPYFGPRKYKGEQARDWPAVAYSPMPGLPPLEVPAMRCELGREKTPEAYCAHLVLCFREVWRVLRDDGVAWCVIGDSFTNDTKWGGASGGKNYTSAAGGYEGQRARRQTGVAPGNLLAIPYRLLLALQADGWLVRQTITWIKGNPMPESVSGWAWSGDRLSKASWRPTCATELVIMLTKRMGYFAESTFAKVRSNIFDSFDASNELPFKPGWGMTSGITAESHHVSINNQLAPYLILACLFAMESVLVKEGDDYFRQIIAMLNAPIKAGITTALITDAFIESPSKIISNIFKHLGVIIAQHDLNSESVLRVGLAVMLASAIPEKETPLSIEQASKVASEIVTNFQAIRDTLSLHSAGKGIIDIDVVKVAVPFRNSFATLPIDRGDFFIAQSLVQQLDFLLREGSGLGRASQFVISHEEPPLDSILPPHYSTEQASRQGHNMWNWIYTTTQPFKGSHYAVFPESLIRPLILSSAPLKCCPVCGAGWAAVVEQKHMVIRKTDYGTDGKAGNRTATAGTMLEPNESSVIGYRPTCQCNAADWQPGLILDPFAGSGTTGLVCRELGLRFVGLDISMEYLNGIALARSERLTPEIALAGLPLFAPLEAER